jgi:AbrB family looped-hinge helix DNA binding protein
MSEVMRGEVTTSVVDKRCKITLPAKIRKQAGLEVGDRVELSVRRDGAVVLVKFTDPLEALIGSAPGLSATADVDGLGGEWEP